MLRKSLVKNSLQSRSVAVGVMAISGVLLVAAALVMFWGISRDGDPTSQATTVVFEVSVPQELSLTEYSSGFMDDGAPLELSGSTVSLQFQEGYLEALDLPIVYSDGQALASFSDASAGIYLEQDMSGQQFLSFPLLSTQGGMPVMVTGTVDTIQRQAQGAQTRVTFASMEAVANLPGVHDTLNGIPSMENIRLVFDLWRLPEDARLVISQIDEFEIATRTSIDSALDEAVGPWTTALAIEVRKTNLGNGEDVGEANLYVTLPKLERRLLDGLIGVHVDDSGHAERLMSEIVSTTEAQTIVRYMSPMGLSIFALMVPNGRLEATSEPSMTSAVTLTPAPSATPTAMPRPTPTYTPTPTLAATVSATAMPTITPPPSPTATPSPSPTALATPVPSAVPTPTPSPTPTPTPPPTSTSPPTSVPLPTSTTTTPPIPVPDEHYAAIVHSHDPSTQQWILDVLGTKWFLDWTSNVDVIPNGHEKIIPILSLPGPSSQTIQNIAQQAPGSVWYIVGEPNRRAGYAVSDIVVQLHDLYDVIKEADPTAKITSPSILNWEFTCIGCGGYTKGSEWLDEFRAAYLTQYEEEPPIDIWAIDLYPLDWWNLPTVNHQLMIDQLIDMREYLNAVGHQSDPIWITELGLHWGWDDILFPGDEDYDASCDPYPIPSGTYQIDQVIGYLDAIFDWLDANAASMSIEKWFLFSTFKEITRCNSSAYAGLTLFDGPETGASLTEVGQFFRDRVLGID